jgi:acrylyl-CoA reductase (NADPH)
MSGTNNDTTCFLVTKENGSVKSAITHQPMDSWPDGEVIVRVSYSSLNFKDALAASGNPGVARSLPIVPGIDAVGTVESSKVDSIKSGDRVFVAHPDFGTASWGGWAHRVRVPATWIYPLPEGLDERTFMIYGTAGFTAAQCVAALQHNRITPKSGPIVVTGATGGVGIFSVKILSQLGYEVVASTGKKDKWDWLKSNGASSIVDREDLNDTSKRPMLSGRWAGAVDTVGGNTLSTVLRSLKIGGCVTACGVVGGAEIPITVYPFILRGVILHGIDSANVSEDSRKHVWQQLAGQWKSDDLENVTTEIGLAELDQQVRSISNGKVAGRVIIKI